MKEVPVITPEIRKEVIKSADAIFFGSPTRFGCMTAQMKSFFDALGGLWFENACVGKVASCFTGTGNQHGGQETTIFSMITPLLHLGFVYVGLPYSCKEQKEISEVSGGTPYGSTFIAASDGSRAVSNNEKACARFQGRHVAQFAKDLKFGRIAQEKKLFTIAAAGASTSGAAEPKESNGDEIDEDADKKSGKKTNSKREKKKTSGSKVKDEKKGKGKGSKKEGDKKEKKVKGSKKK